MDCSQVRLKIYRLACEGFSQRKIASLLCISRQNVYYHIHFLTQNKYLFCKNPNESPKQYGPTDKHFQIHKESKKSERGGRICRVHCIGYKCNVIKLPNVNINWENSFSNNGTSYFEKHWNTDLGRVSIRMISSVKGSQIVFWLPEKYLDKHQLNHWKIIEPRYVDVFYNEFQKRYDCILGELSRYQKPEYAFPEDSEFLFIADKYNLKSDSMWVDCSEGIVESETNDYEIAKAKLELPERLLRLENMMSRIENSIKRIESALVQPSKDFDNGGGYIR